MPLIWWLLIHTHTHTHGDHVHNNTHAQSDGQLCAHIHPEQTVCVCVCLHGMNLTSYHEAVAFCSWFLISSINSPLLLSVATPPPTFSPTCSPQLSSPPYCHHPALNSRHDYVATCCYGNHLLGNQARCLRAGTTLWQLWEDKSITEEEEGFSPYLLFFFLDFHRREDNNIGTAVVKQFN